VTTSAAEVAGLVRLTVVGPERRADLAVPAAVPVADLLPDLARAVAVLDPYLVHGGYRLVTERGDPVASAVGLAAQGIDDGSVLTLEVGAHDRYEPAYDDVVEAVADVVEHTTRPWDTTASRRTALAAAVLLLGTAAVALGLERAQGWPVAATGAVLAVLLLAGSAVLSRSQHADEAATVVAWLAVPFGVVTGLAAAASEPLSELPLALAGAVGFAAALGGTVALRRHRPALLPP
jgi:hypothetical protein